MVVSFVTVWSVPLLKKLVFSNFSIFIKASSDCRSIVYNSDISMSGFSILFHWLMCLLHASTMLVLLLFFFITWNQPIILLSFMIVLSILDLSNFPSKFKVFFFQLLWLIMLEFWGYGGCTESINCFWHDSIFTTLIRWIHEYRYFSPYSDIVFNFVFSFFLWWLKVFIVWVFHFLG